MPLLRDTKLPPPSAPGEKTLWQYLPKQSVRRVLFMLLALGAVLFIKSASGLSFGGLFDPTAPTAPTGAAGGPGFYPIKVTNPAPAKGAP